METKLNIRPAQPHETGLVLEFIKKLAVYEKCADEVVADEATLHHSLFEEHSAEVVFAEEEFLHFCGAQGTLSRRPLHPPRETRQRLWESTAEIPCQTCRRAPLRSYGVDMPRLESVSAEGLSQHRCCPYGRVDSATSG